MEYILNTKWCYYCYCYCAHCLLPLISLASPFYSYVWKQAPPLQPRPILMMVIDSWCCVRDEDDDNFTLLLTLLSNTKSRFCVLFECLSLCWCCYCCGCRHHFDGTLLFLRRFVYPLITVIFIVSCTSATRPPTLLRLHYCHVCYFVVPFVCV